MALNNVISYYHTRQSCKKSIIPTTYKVVGCYCFFWRHGTPSWATTEQSTPHCLQRKERVLAGQYVQPSSFKSKKNMSVTCEPGSKLLVLGMGDLQPLIGNPYNGYINPYYWVDDHPLLYGNNGSLDPSTCLFNNLTPQEKCNGILPTLEVFLPRSPSFLWAAFWASPS